MQTDPINPFCELNLHLKQDQKTNIVNKLERSRRQHQVCGRERETDRDREVSVLCVCERERARERDRERDRETERESLSGAHAGSTRCL